MQAHTPDVSLPARFLRRAGALTALGLLAFVAAGFALQSDSAPDLASGPHATGPVTMFLVRHAETAASTLETRDPDLSTEGHARAAALDELLGAADVTHLFTSPYERTRQTMAPLAERHELTVTEYDPRDAAGLATQLRALPPGSVAVVAGHSNTTPGLAFELCGSWPARLEPDERGGHNLPHDAHERLYLIQLPADTEGEEAGPSLLELTLPPGD